MDEISHSDFEKLDIRVGTVTGAVVPQWSHWVIKLTVDFGELGERTIFAGMMKFYKPVDFEGNQFPFVVNMKPKRIGPADEKGEYNYSQGMMMAADLSTGDNDEDNKPVLFKLTEKVPNGTKVR